MATIIHHTATMTEAESRAWRPEIPGWSTDILPFYSKIQRHIPHGGTFVEVGVFLGRSLAFMAELRPDVAIIAVDPWEDVELDASTVKGYQGPGEWSAYVREHGGTLWEAFLQTMRAHAPSMLQSTKIVRGTSGDVPASTHADVVFIDGAHDYESVKEDIAHAAAWTCNRPGAIISGHDYNPEYNPETHGPDDGRAGVIVAAHELADSLGKPLNLMGTCWWVER